MAPRRLLLAAPVGLAAPLFATAAGLAGPAAPTSLTLRSPLPGLVRIGQTVTVAGESTHLPRRALIVLQGRRYYKTWSVLARGRTGAGGGFTLRWHLGSRTQTGPLTLRVLAYAGSRVAAATKPAQSAIGSRYIPCAKPVPPAQNIPAGDGWIVGGVYIQGGAYPGVDECEAATYQVTASNPSGSFMASQIVAPRHSYTLVVPAGTYTLHAMPTGSSGGCPGVGQATVRAGRQTFANSYCDVP